MLVERAVREAVAAMRYMVAIMIVALFVCLVDEIKIGLIWLVGFDEFSS